MSRLNVFFLLSTALLVTAQPSSPIFLKKWQFTSADAYRNQAQMLSVDKEAVTFSNTLQASVNLRSPHFTRILPGDSIIFNITFSGNGQYTPGYQFYEGNKPTNSILSHPVNIPHEPDSTLIKLHINATGPSVIRPVISLTPGSTAIITSLNITVKRNSTMTTQKSYNGDLPPTTIPQWKPSKFWDANALFKTPQFQNATQYPESDEPGVRAILYDGMPQNGKSDKVFAYIGFPEGTPPKGGFPALVLVHGGGGTAYASYSRFWNKRGYATIAMDLYNTHPVTDKNTNKVTTLPLDGQKCGSFGCAPQQEQHIIKSIGNIVLANSILRSFQNVDTTRTGLIGISWGSVFASVVSTIDTRLNFIIPVYGHGFFDEGDGSSSFCRMGAALWEPGHFLHAAKVPLFWLSGTNDLNFLPPCMQRSWDTAPSTANHTLIIKLPHSHVGYQLPPTLRIVDAMLKGDKPLPKLGKITFHNNLLSAPILQCGKGIKHAQLCYTDGNGPLTLRTWKTLDATLADNRVSASVPDQALIAYLIVFDEKPNNNAPWQCGGSSDILFKPVHIKRIQ